MPDEAAAAAGAATSGAQDAPGATPPATAPGAEGASGGGAGEGASDAAALRSEAASWRVKLRETEAQRDALQARVDAQDLAAVERLAAARLRDPEDLWSAVALAELRDDAGAIDEAKVTAALEALVEKKPHFEAERPPAPDFDAGVRGSRTPAPSFGDALRDAARRPRAAGE